MLLRPAVARPAVPKGHTAVNIRSHSSGGWSSKAGSAGPVPLGDLREVGCESVSVRFVDGYFPFVHFSVSKSPVFRRATIQLG